MYRPKLKLLLKRILGKVIKGKIVSVHKLSIFRKRKPFDYLSSLHEKYHLRSSLVY